MTIDGQPVTELCAASETATMVVMANRGAGGFAELLLGSVSSEVAMFARSAVTVVHVSHTVPDRPNTGRSDLPVLVGADSSAGGSSVMKLDASTGGSASTTVQAEVSTNSNKFFTGTYAARVFFNDAPASGADGDAINETFFTITPLRYDDDPIYSELDYEYLPNGGWGDANPTMYNTSWYTYHNSPSWGGDRVSGSTSKSMQGWHDLVMQVAGGTVTYYIDGTQVFTSNGKYYPRQAMALDFNEWFIDGGLIGGSGTRTYEEKVDWVYHAAGQTLTPADVTAQVTALRSAGTTFTDTVPAA